MTLFTVSMTRIIPLALDGAPRALADDPPLRLSDGGLIRAGFNSELDELRLLRSDSQAFLAKRLPDYWQRFEAHRAAHAQARLSETVESAGWLRQLFAR